MILHIISPCHSWTELDALYDQLIQSVMPNTERNQLSSFIAFPGSWQNFIIDLQIETQVAQFAVVETGLEVLA